MTSLFWYNVYRQTNILRKEPMLMDIILYLLQTIQVLYQQNCWLINFICRYIPLKQWAFDDSHSPKYQKFKIDELPLVSDRTGLTKNSSLTTKSATAKKSAPSAAALNAISLTTATAHAVMPLNRSFTRITAPKASSSVKSVLPDSLQLKAASLP